MGRNNKVTVGDSVELICKVTASNVPMALTWTVQRDDASLDTIMTVYPDGSIKWSGAQRRYQLEVENKRDKVFHYLLINGASHAEAGSYRCSVSVLQDNIYHKLTPSNQVAVIVASPGNSRLGIIHAVGEAVSPH